MEKWHVVFVGLVRAIEKEDGVVARKQFEGERVSKEKCLESSFFIHHCLSCVFRENELVVEVDDGTEALAGFLVDPSFGDVNCALGS